MHQIIKRKSPFLIAEIGINHNGSIKLAKQLINLAKKYNFNVKKIFVKRNSIYNYPLNPYMNLSKLKKIIK